MLTRPALVVGALLLAGGLAGCADGGSPPDSGGQLAERVVSAVSAGAEDLADRLGELGVDVDAGALRDLDANDLRCPTVRAPRPGDRATCQVELGSTDVSIDVEFGAEDEGLTVVGVEAVP